MPPIHNVPCASSARLRTCRGGRPSATPNRFSVPSGASRPSAPLPPIHSAPWRSRYSDIAGSGQMPGSWMAPARQRRRPAPVPIQTSPGCPPSSPWPGISVHTWSLGSPSASVYFRARPWWTRTTPRSRRANHIAPSASSIRLATSLWRTSSGTPAVSRVRELNWLRPPLRVPTHKLPSRSTSTAVTSFSGRPSPAAYS